MAAPNPLDRPAFYALRPGGLRDLITLLHPPYTAWHLSYVALGAVAAPKLHGDRLAATLLAFFLGVGVCAHALDELNGRPLRTRLPDGVLIGLAAVALAGAVGIGIVGAATVSTGLLPFIAVGAFIVVAYNLELFGGRFHSDAWFAAAWGAFPLLTGYVAQAGALAAAAVLGAGFAFALSLAQRRLSTQARHLRRRVLDVRGELRERDGSVTALSRETLIAPAEAALRLLTWATVALALALVCARLS